MSRAKHLIAVGQTFGYLEVIGEPETIERIRYVRVKCQCGAELMRRTQQLVSGRTRSCGCMTSILKRESVKRHGMTNTPEYRTWHTMRQRCTNPKFSAYPNYGGKGVKVCDSWLFSFDAFFADMGPRPKGCTLDRFPNRSGNYEPGNCRWATRAEQAQNKDCVVLNADLVRQIRASKESSLSISRRLGITYSVICSARTGRTWSNV